MNFTKLTKNHFITNILSYFLLFLLATVCFFFISSYFIAVQEKDLQIEQYNELYGTQLAISYDYSQPETDNDLASGFPSVLDLAKMQEFLNSEYLEYVDLDYYLLTYLQNESLLSPAYLRGLSNFTNISLLAGNYPTESNQILIPSSIVSGPYQIGSTIHIYELYTNQFIPYIVTGIYQEEMIINSSIIAPLITTAQSMSDYELKYIDANNSIFHLNNYSEKNSFVDELREKGLEDYFIIEEINESLRPFLLEPITKTVVALSTLFLFSIAVFILSIIILFVLTYQKQKSEISTLLFLKISRHKIQSIIIFVTFPILAFSALLGYLSSHLFLNNLISYLVAGEYGYTSMYSSADSGFYLNELSPISNFSLSSSNLFLFIGIGILLIGGYCILRFRLIRKIKKKDILEEGFIL